MPEFVKNFDCKNKDHVEWLREIGQAMAKITDGEKMDIVAKANANPMGAFLTQPAEFAYVHFQLCMKYANAVLACDAYVPQKNNVDGK